MSAFSCTNAPGPTAPAIPNIVEVRRDTVRGDPHDLQGDVAA